MVAIVAVPGDGCYRGSDGGGGEYKGPPVSSRGVSLPHQPPAGINGRAAVGART